MREIKFRAWDKIEDKMRTDILSIDIGFEVSNCVYFINSDHRRVNDLILMQYTGLKDKNGVEIYEGDIVKNIIYGNIAIIQWGLPKETYCGWCVKWHEPINDQLKYDLLYFNNLINCEVIGNIYAEAKNEKA